jgi:hypothetical protein
VVESAIEVDLRERRITVRAGAGAPITRPLPGGAFEFGMNIQRFALSSTFDEMVVVLPNGEQATVELKGMGRSVERLRRNRPVIYLDQNHWSSIAAARFGHRNVSPGERAAAERLLELVEAEQILLPASGGHLVETAPMFGMPRVALATTILQLSRGWQMRNPVHVRTEEILRHVQEQPPLATDVFTPQANGLFATDRPSPTGSVPDELAVRAILAAVPAILSLYDAIVDEEKIPDIGGEARATAWANNFAGLAHRMYVARESPEMIWRVANGNVIYDVQDSVIAVARATQLAPEGVIDRLMDAGDPISRMPTIAQLRQMLFGRLSNKTQKWKPNDLIDINFLTCAAGYADIVVGERPAIGYLRQASRPSPRAKLASSLAEAVELLVADDD